MLKHALLVTAFCCAGIVNGQDKPLVLKGALVYPVSGAPIPNAVMIVHKGKIERIGPAGTPVPADAVMMDVTGKVIMPGLVDTHSHLAGPDGADASGALSPDTRAMDAVNPTSDGFKKALAGGITTINIMPGSGYLMSGQTVYVKMREGKE